MIPCYGTHGSRQRINNKLIKEEYKIWVLIAEAYGQVVQFRPYPGTKKEKQVASSAKWEFGQNVVLQLQSKVCGLSSTFNFDIFVDKYFTCFCLLTHLGVNNIRATDALKCTITGDKQLQKKNVATLSSAHQAKKQ